MGLDMYLYKRTYINTHNYPGASPKVKSIEAVAIDPGGKESPLRIDPRRVGFIYEEIGYWRKANAIHNWFISNCADGVDECQEVFVPIEKMEELLAIVNEVLKDDELEILVDTKRAAELLPTKDGPFFGDTEYNEWYIESLKETKQILVDALKEGGMYVDFFYRASW
jgi:hypothetical protein